MLNEYGEVVIKKNVGSGGLGIYRASSEEKMKEKIYKLLQQNFSIAICPFYQIAHEYRLVVVGGKIKLIYEKIRPEVVGDGNSTIAQLIERDNLKVKLDESVEPNEILKNGERKLLNWKHNLGQGSTASIINDLKLKQRLEKMAEKVFKIFDLSCGAIDIVDIGGELKVLELNSGVMMEKFSKMGQEYYSISKNVYSEIIKENFKYIK